MKINTGIIIKGLIVLLMAALGISTLIGCQLAHEDAGEETEEDRLIGVLVTDEYLDLFDFEGYFNDNIGSISSGEIEVKGNTDKYERRLYAELKERVLTDKNTGKKTTTAEYVFENVPGISYFAATIPETECRESYVTSGSDEAISDGHLEFFHGDDEEKITLEGTIYVSAIQNGKTYSYYINPVYQSVDGRVYVISGTGITLDSVQAEGSAFSQNLDETATSRENGKSKELNTLIKISLKAILPPEKIVILEMDENSSIIESRDYSPGEVPDKLVPKEKTEYIIVETHKRDETGTDLITRELFSKKDESLSTFFCRKDGICVKVRTQLMWEGGSLEV